MEEIAASMTMQGAGPHMDKPRLFMLHVRRPAGRAHRLEATMPQSLTDLERHILDYLVEYLRRNTYQPSIREIGRRFQIKSTKTVSELLQSLAVKGYIERDASRSRGVRLLGLSMEAATVSVPFYGGVSSPAERTPLEAFELDRKLAGASGTFLVTMQGDVLSAEGIRDGDLLLVEPVSNVESGDIVLARVQGASAIRRFARQGSGAVLETSQAGTPAVRIPVDAQVKIEGRVISVVRRLRAPRDAAENGGPGH
jgi:repressor LexA